MHAINDLPTPRDVLIRATLFRNASQIVADGERTIALTPNSTTAVSIDGMLERFVDLTYAYRFGPPNHELTAITMVDADSGAWLSDAFHFPQGHAHHRVEQLPMSATLRLVSDNRWVLHAGAESFARSVCIEATGFTLSDNYFHLAAGQFRQIDLTRDATAPATPTVSLWALNAHNPIDARLIQ